jgi:thiosulfate/3-mercaptopyruvate sulfurtransferase
VVAFKVMGHEKVWVLDGGLPAWIKEGYATEKRQEQLYEKVILLQISNRSCLKLKKVLENIQTKKLCLLMPIYRSFSCRNEEPRAGLRSGHIPVQ